MQHTKKMNDFYQGGKDMFDHIFELIDSEQYVEACEYYFDSSLQEYMESFIEPCIYNSDGYDEKLTGREYGIYQTWGGNLFYSGDFVDGKLIELMGRVEVQMSGWAPDRIIMVGFCLQLEIILMASKMVR